MSWNSGDSRQLFSGYNEQRSRDWRDSSYKTRDNDFRGRERDMGDNRQQHMNHSGRDLQCNNIRDYNYSNPSRRDCSSNNFNFSNDCMNNSNNQSSYGRTNSNDSFDNGSRNFNNFMNMGNNNPNNFDHLNYNHNMPSMSFNHGDFGDNRANFNNSRNMELSSNNFTNMGGNSGMFRNTGFSQNMSNSGHMNSAGNQGFTSNVFNGGQCNDSTNFCNTGPNGSNFGNGPNSSNFNSMGANTNEFRNMGFNQSNFNSNNYCDVPQNNFGNRSTDFNRPSSPKAFPAPMFPDNSMGNMSNNCNSLQNMNSDKNDYTGMQHGRNSHRKDRPSISKNNQRNVRNNIAMPHTRERNNRGRRERPKFDRSRSQEKKIVRRVRSRSPISRRITRDREPTVSHFRERTESRIRPLIRSTEYSTMHDYVEDDAPVHEDSVVTKVLEKLLNHEVVNDLAVELLQEYMEKNAQSQESESYYDMPDQRETIRVREAVRRAKREKELRKRGDLRAGLGKSSDLRPQLLLKKRLKNNKLPVLDRITNVPSLSQPERPKITISFEPINGVIKWLELSRWKNLMFDNDGVLRSKPDIFKRLATILPQEALQCELCKVTSFNSHEEFIEHLKDDKHNSTMEAFKEYKQCVVDVQGYTAQILSKIDHNKYLKMRGLKNVQTTYCSTCNAEVVTDKYLDHKRLGYHMAATRNKCCSSRVFPDLSVNHWISLSHLRFLHKSKHNSEKSTNFKECEKAVVYDTLYLDETFYRYEPNKMYSTQYISAVRKIKCQACDELLCQSNLKKHCQTKQHYNNCIKLMTKTKNEEGAEKEPTPKIISKKSKVDLLKKTTTVAEKKEPQKNASNSPNKKKSVILNKQKGPALTKKTTLARRVLTNKRQEPAKKEASNDNKVKSEQKTKDGEVVIDEEEFDHLNMFLEDLETIDSWLSPHKEA